MTESRAFEHFRVERVRSGDLEGPPRRAGLFRRTKKPKATAADQIRILDRHGVVVWQQWVEPRAAEQQEAQIVEDLLSMGVEAFRVKWKIGE